MSGGSLFILYKIARFVVPELLSDDSLSTKKEIQVSELIYFA